MELYDRSAKFVSSAPAHPVRHVLGVHVAGEEASGARCQRCQSFTSTHLDLLSKPHIGINLCTKSVVRYGGLWRVVQCVCQQMSCKLRLPISQQQQQ
jgi:hypothetical protein